MMSSHRDFDLVIFLRICWWFRRANSVRNHINCNWVKVTFIRYLIMHKLSVNEQIKENYFSSENGEKRWRKKILKTKELSSGFAFMICMEPVGWEIRINSMKSSLCVCRRSRNTSKPYKEIRNVILQKKYANKSESLLRWNFSFN